MPPDPGPRPVDRPVIDHLIVVDFEGTCDPSENGIPRLEQCDVKEIIEFPAVWIAARDIPERHMAAGTEIDHFQEYVKPVGTSGQGEARQLTDFCTQLTGITQDKVQGASPLRDVLARFERWLAERSLITALRQGTAVLVAHGEWDLGDQLPREAARKGIVLPDYLAEYADLKVVFCLACPDNRGTSLKQESPPPSPPPCARRRPPPLHPRVPSPQAHTRDTRLRLPSANRRPPRAAPAALARPCRRRAAALVAVSPVVRHRTAACKRRVQPRARASADAAAPRP